MQPCLPSCNLVDAQPCPTLHPLAIHPAPPCHSPVQVSMKPGSAYVLTGQSQGTTKFCQKGCIGHNRCNCCWTHGVQVDKLSTVST